MISLVSDELLNDEQSRGFFANLSINLGHHMYLCSRDQNKGSVNETSACGNLYYVPFAPDFNSAVNRRAFDYLIVEPLNSTQRLQLANSTTPTLMMQAMVEVYENNTWWALFALLVVIVLVVTFYGFGFVNRKSRLDLARNANMLALSTHGFWSIQAILGIVLHFYDLGLDVFYCSKLIGL